MRDEEKGGLRTLLDICQQLHDFMQEKGSMREVVSAPKSDYTKLLLSQYREDKDED